jgi:antitoxin VapB
MALSIKNRELEEVSRELARLTGKPMTEALLEGARRELKRQKSLRSMQPRPRLWDRIQEIQKEFAALPKTGSTLTDDEVLGYDEFGIPSR